MPCAVNANGVKCALKIIKLVLLLHLSAIVGYEEPATKEQQEMAIMVLRQGAMMLLPIIVMLETHERGLQEGLPTQRQRDLFREATYGAVALIFDTGVNGCIEYMRDSFDHGRPCNSQWFTGEENQTNKELAKRCEKSLLGASTKCYLKGFPRAPPPEVK